MHIIYIYITYMCKYVAICMQMVSHMMYIGSLYPFIYQTLCVYIYMCVYVKYTNNMYTGGCLYICTWIYMRGINVIQGCFTFLKKKTGTTWSTNVR